MMRESLSLILGPGPGHTRTEALEVLSTALHDMPFDLTGIVLARADVAEAVAALVSSGLDAAAIAGLLSHEGVQPYHVRRALKLYVVDKLQHLVYIIQGPQDHEV